MSRSETDATDLRSQVEMEFLTAIERGEVVSQMSLTQRIGVSVGMVNALVKRAVGKGYAKMSQAPYKRYAYYLTPQGFAEKGRLVAQYLETSLVFFRRARGEYEQVFASAKARNQKTILLCGEGELLEIAVIAAMAQGVRLSGLLDLSGSDAEGAVLDLPRRHDLEGVDLVVLTDRRAPQDSYEQVKTMTDGRRPAVVAPAFFKITPDRAALLAQFDDSVEKESA